MAAVCVYCASGPVPSRYLDLAAELGTALGSSGHTLVSGGGNVSMMGAGTLHPRRGREDRRDHPGHLVDREAADTDSDELIVTETMRERKRLMGARADGFITLPGGIGTLEELFETWTGGFLGSTTSRSCFSMRDGFYQPMLRWLDSLHAEGFVSPAALERLLVADRWPMP